MRENNFTEVVTLSQTNKPEFCHEKMGKCFTQITPKTKYFRLVLSYTNIEFLSFKVSTKKFNQCKRQRRSSVITYVEGRRT